MTFGFSVKNGSNQIVVSSDTKNMHFMGKATYTGPVVEFTDASSSGAGFANGLSIFRYVINCAAFPFPFFTQPGWQYQALISVAQIGPALWQFDLAVDGPTAGKVVPEVYVFAEAGGMVYPPSESYGMQVLTSDGSVAFDSRLPPFTAIAGGTVAPALPTSVNRSFLSPVKVCQWGTFYESDPEYSRVNAYLAFWNVNGVKGLAHQAPFSIEDNTYPISNNGPDIGALTAAMYDQRWDFAPNIEAYQPVLVNGAMTKPMFCYYGLGQAFRQMTSKGTSSEIDGNWWSTTTTYHDVRAWWWANYRSGIQWDGEGLFCSWICTAYGYNYDYRSQSTTSNWFTDSHDGGNGTGGSLPAANTQINPAPIYVMIADGAIYD
jgi:hypothetical protein